MLRTPVVHGRVAAAMGLLMLLTACAPALDWREVRPQDSDAVAMFPCKPTVDTRMVTLAGARVRMSLAACRAGDVTWALAYADVADPARVTPALQDLRAGMVANIAGVSAASSAPAVIPGMTPNAQAAHLQLQGQLPDGATVRLEGGFFARGTHVYQATAMGQKLDAEAVSGFFNGLKLNP